MAKSSYLRFNPENREIELEGTEQFIKTYFDKLRQMLPPLPADGNKEPKKAIAFPAKKANIKAIVAAEMPAPKKVVKVAGKKTVARKTGKISLIDTVVGLVNKSVTGMTSDELKDATGITPKQIWAITSRAAKLGRIKTTKRGVYVPV
jgi:hypothetical protein